MQPIAGVLGWPATFFREYRVGNEEIVRWMANPSRIRYYNENRAGW